MLGTVLAAKKGVAELGADVDDAGLVGAAEAVGALVVGVDAVGAGAVGAAAVGAGVDARRRR